MRAVAVDINFLTQTFFYFDEPVPYKLADGEIRISPVMLRDSPRFLGSFDILTIDKNSIPDVEIIQMTYLQYILDVLFKDEKTGDLAKAKFLNIMDLCLGLKKPAILRQENKKPCIYDEELKIVIDSKQFDEIKRIILYQNIPNYDDDYINPELKQAMNEVDEVKNKNIDLPSIERKMAIITSHSGIPKADQMQMTYRSHAMLFDEVVGEVEFTTVRPVALICGAKDQDHWIYKKKKDKFEGYVQSLDSYQEKIGGNKALRSTDNTTGDLYEKEYNNFVNN